MSETATTLSATASLTPLPRLTTAAAVAPKAVPGKRERAARPERRMKEEWWPGVMDLVIDWMDSEMLELGEVKDRFRRHKDWQRVLGEEDLEELERRVKEYRRNLMLEDRRKEELAPTLATGGLLPASEREVPRAQERGVMGMLAEAISWVLGVGVAEMRTEWRRGPSRVLYEGDEAVMLHGPGADWLVCAVRITRADGRTETLAEHKIRSRGHSPQPGYRGVRLHLLRLEMVGKAHNADAMMRRAAAVALAYGGERSGMKDMVELARLNGVSKQAVQQQMNVLRRQHEKATGEPLARIGGSGAACGRRRGVGGKRKMTKSEGQNPKGERA